MYKFDKVIEEDHGDHSHHKHNHHTNKVQQKLVFIGVHMDKQETKLLLENCLLSSDDLFVNSENPFVQKLSSIQIHVNK